MDTVELRLAVLQMANGDMQRAIDYMHFIETGTLPDWLKEQLDRQKADAEHMMEKFRRPQYAPVGSGY